MRAALIALGCEQADETQRHFWIARGAVKLVSVPKMMVSGKAQRDILNALDFTSSEDLLAYSRALTAAIAKRSED